MGSFNSTQKHITPKVKVLDGGPASSTKDLEAATDERPGFFGRRGKRVAVIVTAPFDKSSGQIVPIPEGTCSLINWDSRDRSALPRLISRRTYSPYSALCLMDSSKWDDNSLTLRERFAGEKFWDYPNFPTKPPFSSNDASAGDTVPVVCNAGRVWKPREIEAIDAGQEYFRLDLSDEEMAELHKFVSRISKYQQKCLDLVLFLAYPILAPSKMAFGFLWKRMSLFLQAYCPGLYWCLTVDLTFAATDADIDMLPLATVGVGGGIVNYMKGVGFRQGIAG
ncbi:uncharacterized protein KD926_004891 [Aspergillus affinis]|uniref:uncharacterized protein n=1 Tax=Aspergillus affinis TaxID=1070780 RepID=UPI0022FEC362|nr:uncharacterized protein KD926_004891 [Aspergillus affinis]KAI9042826.1 hypothetical protein KD926_004891 [Aspergillus affinis]